MRYIALLAISLLFTAAAQAHLEPYPHVHLLHHVLRLPWGLTLVPVIIAAVVWLWLRSRAR